MSLSWTFMLSSAVLKSVAWFHFGLHDLKMRTFEELAAVDLARCNFKRDYVSLLVSALFRAVAKRLLTYSCLIEELDRDADGAGHFRSNG
jgi:hypothetical protein